MKHTPGPWTIQLAQDYDEAEFEITYDVGNLTYTIADIFGNLAEGEPEANAKLIAAAPILLKRLIDLVNDYERIVGASEIDSNPGAYQEFFDAESAIAAATE